MSFTTKNFNLKLKHKIKCTFILNIINIKYQIIGLKYLIVFIFHFKSQLNCY